MRAVFIKKLHQAMRQDERLFLLIGDTGFNLVEPLFAEFPDRTLNVGIAEQNLIGISAGLCNIGFRPICYAISNFLTLRCLEQIRNDICLHQYPVILAGTSAGLDNGGLWATHYVVDDIGCLKALPNINIYSPSSLEAMDQILAETFQQTKRASYIRIAKGSFSEGQAIKSFNRFVLEQPGVDTLVIAHGKMVKQALEASKLSPTFSIFGMDRIKPLEEKTLGELCRRYQRIFVIEDNFSSGLYNSICQFVVERNLRDNKIQFIGPAEDYGQYIGDVNYLFDQAGLTPEKISGAITQS